MFPRWSVLTLLVFPSASCMAEGTENKLLESLQAVPELRLLSDEQVAAYRQTQDAAMKAKRLTGTQWIAARHAGNLELHKAFLAAGLKQGLPLIGKGATRDRPSAVVIQKLSSEMRKNGFGFLVPTQNKGLQRFEKWCDDNSPEDFPGCAQTFLQILQVEDASIRKTLIERLAKDESVQASQALANRALMDLSADVRLAAVEELKKRPEKEYLPVLLDGLRYPWPPVADHAADALGKLKPQDSVNKLIDLLDEPDPRAAFLLPKSKRPRVAELVKINHLRNCLLCHAPSSDKGDLIRAGIPTPGERITVYYASRSKDVVRADTTLLRQHFSTLLKVKNAEPWPEMQRFDFVVRLRQATPDEIARSKTADLDYPQRRAVLRALEKVTGKSLPYEPGLYPTAPSASRRWRALLKTTTREK